MTNLTLKEQAFVKEVVNTLNPTEAVRRVYDLGSKGGSKTKKQRDQTARAIASENLTKPHIKKELGKLLKDLKITKEDRLSRLAEIFWDKDKRSSIAANQEITKMLGEYQPAEVSLVDKQKEKRKEFFE